MVFGHTRGQLGTKGDSTGLIRGECQFAIKGGQRCVQVECQLQVGCIVSGELVFPSQLQYGFLVAQSGSLVGFDRKLSETFQKIVGFCAGNYLTALRDE